MFIPAPAGLLLPLLWTPAVWSAWPQWLDQRDQTYLLRLWNSEQKGRAGRTQAFPAGMLKPRHNSQGKNQASAGTQLGKKPAAEGEPWVARVKWEKREKAKVCAKAIKKMSGVKSGMLVQMGEKCVMDTFCR